jgi:hypothetical protein
MKLSLRTLGLIEIDEVEGLDFYMSEGWAIQKVENSLNPRLDFYTRVGGPKFSIHFPNKKELNRFFKQKGDIEFRYNKKKK